MKSQDSNICYANSAVQILFHCKQFRQKVLNFQPKQSTKDYLTRDLQDLFQQMTQSSKSKGNINSKKFMQRIKKLNQLFDNDDHHDSHEFLIWLLNHISEELQADINRENKQKNQETNNKIQQSSPNPYVFVQDLFEGKLVSKISCNLCECANERDEPFMALSVDIEKGSSLNHCIKQFAHKEWMLNRDKFYCEQQCYTKQVATKQMMIKQKPKILIIHLKRFKIDPQTLRYQKLSHRIPFPNELRIESALDESEDSSQSLLYHLKGIVIHVGQGFSYGHYFSLIKSQGRWIKMDDTNVSVVDEKYMRALYGLPSSNEQSGWPTAYMLLYDSQPDE
ncbi:ubiquitin carboxyl-terminal hydrolase 12 [Stylonychia lemnae]|uniref:ubiquitinyl hydrolase 1 n=1 Tax=Stylonychia lemnae TaxID=5949 RepID=A0A078B950_STYLE|nr:ubiquitin carboxyl-terminal hydrolase 12 [Stylonychia lemnae]|eukprot:CDW91045.1 ubiquitin carboxyl-terminal hydrolase 12 [Stylonychia lemnae]